MKTLIQNTSALFLSGMLLFSLPSCDSNTEDSKDVAEERNEEKFETKAGEKEAQFIVDVAAVNYAEIRMAQLASQKSANGEIKTLAGELEKEHTAMLNEVKEYAAKKSITVPTEESQEAKDDITDLQDEKPADFDKKWCNEQMDYHKIAIDKFEKASDDLADADLKNWVNTNLPKLKQHQDKLKACHEKLK